LNILKDDLEKERADKFLISENKKLHKEVEHARRKADAAETKYRNVINQKRSIVQNMMDKCSEMKEKYKAEMENKTKKLSGKNTLLHEENIDLQRKLRCALKDVDIAQKKREIAISMRKTVVLEKYRRYRKRKRSV
jgi:hypothetical protein